MEQLLGLYSTMLKNIDFCTLYAILKISNRKGVVDCEINQVRSK